MMAKNADKSVFFCSFWKVHSEIILDPTWYSCASWLDAAKARLENAGGAIAAVVKRARLTAVKASSHSRPWVAHKVNNSFLY